MPVDLKNDQQVLAATIWGEARGEPETGRQAVAAVVMNRCAIASAYRIKAREPHPLFGDGCARNACLARYQFSCWNGSDPNRPLILALDFAHPDALLLDCIDIAEWALSGTLPDPTHGATHYKVTSLAWPHSWGAQKEPLAVIGHQSFYQI